MPDREKVINGLECCLEFCEHLVYKCDECPYRATEDERNVIDWRCHLKELRKDALELLKAQESIVRCKDCKHYAVEDHYGNFHGYEILAASDIPTCHRWGNDACMVKPDGYCFLAESR